MKNLKAYDFDDTEVAYDVIFGRHFLNQENIDVISSKLKRSWYGDEILFQPPYDSKTISS